MAGQAAWITEHMVTQDASTMNAGKRYENLSALNPAHLKALLGQDVVLTLADGSTRTGNVFTVDPVNFSVALLKPRRPLIRGSPVANNKETDPVCVIPGHAVKGVEIAGGQKLALEALRGGGAGMLGRNCVGGIGMIPVHHFQPGASAPKPERSKMSLEFLRSYSNPPAAAAAASSSPAPSSSSSNHHAGLGGGGGLHGSLNGGNGVDYNNNGYNNNRGGPGMNHLSRGGVDGSPYGDFGGYGMAMPNGAGAGAGGGFGLGLGPGPAGGTGITGMGLEAVAERRRRVRSALEHARVPVEEVSESDSPAPALVVMGCVRVPPPYTADTCECANEIVLSKVRQLVDNVR